MADVIVFLSAPLAMAIVLAGIHCYFGLHVLQRGVIFIDLSLAQVAALGTVVSFLLHFEHDSTESYIISLGFTLLAALYLAIVNNKKNAVSQEAIIGILYAFSSALIVVLLDFLTHGAEHLKSALVGQVLWVTWPDVVRTIAIYFGVGVCLAVFGKTFLHSNQKGWLGDFLFYALFGVVITSSVHVAGVLLVFSLLIVPALVSSLFSTNFNHRLIFSWIFSVVFCTLGIICSYVFDWPAGATLVIVLGIVGLVSVSFGRSSRLSRELKSTESDAIQ